MEFSEIIMSIAVIVGPIAAVQIQKWKERSSEEKHRKVIIFKTLMTTRASKLSQYHVEALNMIDIEFIDKKYENVVQAWRSYHDHLSNGDPKSANWIDKNGDLFIDLLFEMGKSLNYKFDKVMLKRTAYSPIAHGDQEYEQAIIRKGLASILEGKTSFQVFFTNEFENQKVENKAN